MKQSLKLFLLVFFKNMDENTHRFDFELSGKLLERENEIKEKEREREREGERATNNK